MMMKRQGTLGRAVIGALIWAITAGHPADALVTGSIFGPGTAAIPVAVVPLVDGGGGVAGARFGGVLARDLVLSGYFRLVDSGRFPERPPNVRPGLQGTDFLAWEAAGAQVVIKGVARGRGDTVTLEVHVIDVGAKQELSSVSRRFEGRVQDVPRMAHRVADALLEHLTGVPGPFDSQVVFTRRSRGPLKDIFHLTFDAERPRRLSREPSLAVAPRWHPGGRRVLFTSYRAHTPQLFELHVGTGRVRRLIESQGALLGGAWSPDGSRLLVTREKGGNTDIYLVDRNGTPLRRLTDHWSVDVSPAWSQDGRRFAFCSSRSGSPQIYVMGIDGTGLRRLSRTGGYNTSPAWSPTGQHVAYTTRAGGMQIAVVDVDGRGAQVITSGGPNEDPTWGPSGRYLVYSSRRASGRRLVLTDRDGRVHHELTVGPGDDSSPAWARRVE
jgi:TolB protein